MPLEFWRQGSTPVPVSGIGAFARELEALGWDGLSIGEAHGILPDPYTTLAAAAAATTGLKVGTAVSVPLREPILAASAMLTLQVLSGGRAAFSLGRGDGAVKVLGRPIMPVDRFGAYVRDVQALLTSRDVDIAGGGRASMKFLREIDPSVATALKPPIDVAATGPKMIRLAATIADSVSFAMGADVDRIRQGIELARGARIEAGLDPDTLGLGCYVQIAVTGPRSVAEARDRIRALAFTHSRFSAFHGEALADVPSADEGRFRSIIEASEAEWRGGARTLLQSASSMDEDLLDRFAVIGPAELCASRLREIAALGVDRFYLGTTPVFEDETNTRLVGEHVLPLLR